MYIMYVVVCNVYPPNDSWSIQPMMFNYKKKKVNHFTDNTYLRWLKDVFNFSALYLISSELIVEYGTTSFRYTDMNHQFEFSNKRICERTPNARWNLLNFLFLTERLILSDSHCFCMPLVLSQLFFSSSSSMSCISF